MTYYHWLGADAQQAMHDSKFAEVMEQIRADVDAHILGSAFGRAALNTIKGNQSGAGRR